MVLRLFYLVCLNVFLLSVSLCRSDEGLGRKLFLEGGPIITIQRCVTSRFSGSNPDFGVKILCFFFSYFFFIPSTDPTLPCGKRGKKQLLPSEVAREAALDRAPAALTP